MAGGAMAEDGAGMKERGTEEAETGRPSWFELSELRLFNEAGENVAPQARVELLLQPSNPDDAGMVNDDLFWGSGGHFVVWQNEHAFHGRDLVKLTFSSPQSITGAELYSTNYESFGTDGLVIADGVTSLPVRMVFLADNNPDAMRDMAARFLEAQDRGLWQTRLNSTRPLLERLATGAR